MIIDDSYKHIRLIRKMPDGTNICGIYHIDQNGERGVAWIGDPILNSNMDTKTVRALLLWDRFIK